jgi:hypothetical protein
MNPALALAACIALLPSLPQDEFDALLERLRRQNPGEAAKVEQLPRADALRFLKQRFAGAPADPKTSPARTERFTVVETLAVGDCSIELVRRDDGSFGLGRIRLGALELRRADFPIVWRIDGRAPSMAGRRGLTVTLRDPEATLTFAPEERTTAGTRWRGFSVELAGARDAIVETASWEPGGTTHGLSFQDGYRGWHAPPQGQAADAVAETNPKLMPGMLSGTGFQLLHGPAGALATFHTLPGDRLKTVSRGEALEFETTWTGAGALRRFVLLAGGDSRINLWTRAFEVAHAELRRAFELPARPREILLLWPTHDRAGFRETARLCAETTAREGFTGAAIDVVWDNLAEHGGAKNMNVWSYAISEAYGGAAGLKALVEECHGRGLKVVAWCPAGHLVDRSPVWKEHPDWLAGRTPSTTKEGAGPVYGSLHTGFGEYWRSGVLSAVRTFQLDGLWMDSHLPYPAQPRDRPHAAALARAYVEFARAGAVQMIVEGDASALGSYGIGIDESWERIPEPDLFYDSTMLGWGNDPTLYTRHFRRYVAAGAAWVVSWDVLTSPKLAGPEWEAARAEIRAVVRDYRRVKDRMVHRFLTGDGVVWTNDRDASRVVWLHRDARLPDGTAGKAGGVYVVP